MMTTNAANLEKMIADTLAEIAAQEALTATVTNLDVLFLIATNGAR